MGKPKVKQPRRKPKLKVGLKQQQSPAVKKENPIKPSPFALLSNEMVEHILNFLPLQDKKSARLVSQQWSQVLNGSVSVGFKIPLNPEALVELHRRPYAINELEVVLNRDTIPPAFAFTEIIEGSFLSTKSLSFKGDEYCFSEGTFPGINSLDGVGVMALINACQNIHTLKFNFQFLEIYVMNVPICLDNVQLEHLRTLQLKLAYGGKQEVIHTLLQLRTPQLRNLEVERFKYGKGSEADRSIYLALQRFMGRNNGTLKSIKLVNILTNITLNSARSSPTVFPADMLLELGQLKLESLEIQHSDSRMLREDNDLEDWPAANQILDQFSLKVLKLHMASEDIIQKSYILLANCKDTLTKLDLNVEGVIFQFNMNALSQLKCLTNLTFTSAQVVREDTFFPHTIKYLTWNAPLHYQWYSLWQRTVFPVLLKMRIGAPGPLPNRLARLCQVFFGISSLGDDASTRTKLQLITIGRRLRSSPAVETRSQYCRRNMDVAAAVGLPQEIYHVVYDTDNIRIGIQSGIPI